MQAAKAKEIENIYNQYYHVLNPLVQSYEALSLKFPTEILNEIRSIFTHLSRCYEPFATEEFVSDNINGAQSHLKRAILDGFKYNIISYQTKIEEFHKSHERVMSLIDNGAFINVFYSSVDKAQEAFTFAKNSEAEGVCSIDELYGYFEIAYNLFSDLYKMIKVKSVDADKVKALVDSEYKKKYKISLIFNIAMAVVSVASLVIGIVFGVK